jgi:hypothetical protein
MLAEKREKCLKLKKMNVRNKSKKMKIDNQHGEISGSNGGEYADNCLLGYCVV